MGIDETKRPSLIPRTPLTEPWRKFLHAVHRAERGGNASTFENGMHALERLLITGQGDRERETVMASRLGFQATELISDFYREMILEPREDEFLPLEPFPGGGILARTSIGDIAVAPRSAAGREDISQSAITVFDDRTFSDDGIPRLMIPSARYLVGDMERPWVNILGNMTALGGDLMLQLDEENFTIEVNEMYGSFLGRIDLADPFVERVKATDDPKILYTAWKEHVGALIPTMMAANRSLERKVKRYESIGDMDKEIDVNGIAILRQVLGRSSGLIKQAEASFMTSAHVAGSWEHDFVRCQIAKFNNAKGPLMMFLSMGMSPSEIGGIVRCFDDCVDPINHHTTVYMDKKIKDWVDVELVGDYPNKGEGTYKYLPGITRETGANLRFIMDEIVYRAGIEGKGHVELSFNDGVMQVVDKVDGESLKAFLPGSAERDGLIELVSRLGPEGSIDFIEESFPDRESIDHIIRISYPTIEGGGQVGTNEGGSKAKGSTTSSSGTAAQGFGGVIEASAVESTVQFVGVDAHVSDGVTNAVEGAIGLANQNNFMLQSAASAVELGMSAFAAR